MDNIAELERRITAALVKIDQGIEAYASVQEAKLGAATQALAAAHAQAQALSEAQAEMQAEMQAQLQAQVQEQAQAQAEAQLQAQAQDQARAQADALAELQAMAQAQIAAAQEAAALAQAEAAEAVAQAMAQAAERAAELAAQADAGQGMPVATLADGVAEAEIARLNEALDEERFKVSQLHERLRAARQKEATLEQEAGEKAAFETEISRQSRLLEQQSVEMGRLKAAVTALRNELRHLREASLSGNVGLDMINSSMVAELEAMRAERAAEAVELRELLAALDPLALVQEEGAENA